MEETDFFLAAIADQYKLHQVTLHPLRSNSPNGKRLYRVDHRNGPSWVLRAYHPDFARNKVFTWLSNPYPSIFTWLQARASLLVYLTLQGYPAPLLVPSKSGALVGTYQEWHMTMMTFIDGDAKETTPEKMQALGAGLGHLHMLPLPSSKGCIGISWWEPSAAIRYAQDSLVASAAYTPQEWRAAHAAFSHTFHVFQQYPRLARSIIHADCWAENGIQTRDGQVILIDWECGGLGLPIIDLGSLLLHCHFDQIDLPEYRPDPTRIAAVVQGYYRWRPLPRKELDVLLEAIRFSIAWRGFGLLDLSDGQQLSEARQQRLTEWWRWYAISDEIARIALDIVGRDQLMQINKIMCQ